VSVLAQHALHHGVPVSAHLRFQVLHANYDYGNAVGLPFVRELLFVESAVILDQREQAVRDLLQVEDDVRVLAELVHTVVSIGRQPRSRLSPHAFERDRVVVHFGVQTDYHIRVKLQEVFDVDEKSSVVFELGPLFIFRNVFLEFGEFADVFTLFEFFAGWTPSAVVLDGAPRTSQPEHFDEFVAVVVELEEVQDLLTLQVDDSTRVRALVFVHQCHLVEGVVRVPVVFNQQFHRFAQSV